MSAYPQWMNGDQLCAKAERRADEDAVYESLEDEAYALADQWLDKDDPALPLPGGASLSQHLWDTMPDWKGVADTLAISAIAGASPTYDSPTAYGNAWGRQKAHAALLPLAMAAVTQRRAEAEEARRQAYEDRRIEDAQAEMGGYA